MGIFGTETDEVALATSPGTNAASVRSLTAHYVAIAFSTICLLHHGSAAAQTGLIAGSVKGQVVVAESTRSSYVPGAVISLDGPEHLSTTADSNGKYGFPSVNPGIYIIKAAAPGLDSQQTISVASGNVAEVPLTLRVAKTTTDVTVSANSGNAADVTTNTQTIDQKTIDNAPNANERFETLLPLVPGVVRGPDGRINMKGARNTQSGALVNSANVTDPASGGPAINLPIDVVSSIQVVSNPFDPQYGRFTGALSTVETKTGDYEKMHFSVQNIVPRLRDRAGTIAGLDAATPRLTLTGPLVRHRAAFTQSFEYRFVRTPVNSLPPLQRDTKLEGFNSYTQADITLDFKQTATVSLAVYPQKLNYMGLNTFTPQPSTTDFKQRGYQVYAQHRYFPNASTLLTSQFSYKTYDVDINAQSDDPYRLLVDTTEGGFFNRQHRRTARYEVVEGYKFAPHRFFGSHQFNVGADYVHSDLDGIEIFHPVDIVGVTGNVIEGINFSSPSSFVVHENEAASYLSDRWAVSKRISLDLGIRLDGDSITDSIHFEPRAGVLLSLTGDGKTLLKGGAGIFYDRVPLMFPPFAELPGRTVTLFGPGGQVSSSTAFVNQIASSLENPRSTTWSLELDRQVTSQLAVRVAYENRNTARDFVVSPVIGSQSGAISLSNAGSDSYREFQVSGKYQINGLALNGSYVRSRAYGDLNDPLLFVGNNPQAVIQVNQKGRSPYDAPTRLLFWSDIHGPLKLNISPVYDEHTGFPYSVQNEFREYVGPRSSVRFPEFCSMDLQITRPFTVHFRDKGLTLRAGGSVFNLFNHDNPRDVQSIRDSASFGSFYNNAWREYRGKLVFQF